MGRIGGLLCVVMGVLAIAPVAGADRGTATFEGTCQLSGTVRHDPPLTNTPQLGRGFASASGTCSGTWADERGQVHALDGDRVRYSARAEGELSCGGGSSTGRGYLQFGGDKLYFGFREARGPGTAALDLEGEAGGRATGQATVSPNEDPVQIAMKCAGDGVRTVQVDISLESPGISG